jgi:hypothetical protein
MSLSAGIRSLKSSVASNALLKQTRGGARAFHVSPARAVVYQKADQKVSCLRALYPYDAPRVDHIEKKFM